MQNSGDLNKDPNANLAFHPVEELKQSYEYSVNPVPEPKQEKNKVSCETSKMQTKNSTYANNF